jgi:ubiquitin carboxyl-terminal hydrolase L3
MGWSDPRTRKSFIPLESNPEVFNELISLLGAPSGLSFEDVYTLDEVDFLPHPALALIMIFPPDASYEAKARRDEAEFRREEYTGSGDGEPVVWFRQTIYNACGLYAILHALSNGEARSMIRKLSSHTRYVDWYIVKEEGRSRS